MKARVITNVKEIREEVNRQMTEKKFELMQEIASELAVQVLANVLVTLEKSYGFKQKRLQGFVDNLKSMCDLMSNPLPITHRFDVDDNIDDLKEKYGIDLKKEFKFDVVKK